MGATNLKQEHRQHMVGACGCMIRMVHVVVRAWVRGGVRVRVSRVWLCVSV